MSTARKCVSPSNKRSLDFLSSSLGAIRLDVIVRRLPVVWICLDCFKYLDKSGKSAVLVHGIGQIWIHLGDLGSKVRDPNGVTVEIG